MGRVEALTGDYVEKNVDLSIYKAIKMLKTTFLWPEKCNCFNLFVRGDGKMERKLTPRLLKWKNHQGERLPLFKGFSNVNGL